MGSQDATGSVPLHVRTDQREFVALHPAFGPDRPRRLWELIRKDNLVEPTAFQVISLVNALYRRNGLESREMELHLGRNEMEYSGENSIHEEGDAPFGIQTFTAVLSDPYQRRLTFFDCPTCWDKEGLNRESLTRRTVEQSQKTRMISYREACLHRGKELRPQEIEKNPLIIALCGNEGAVYAAELVNKTPHQRAYVHSPQSIDSKQPEVSLAKIYKDKEGAIRFNTGSPLLSMGYTFALKPDVK